MWNFETLWQAIATSPFLWGAAAIALISLAFLWRNIAHANFVRRWEVKQQLLQDSARLSNVSNFAAVETSRSASARATSREEENSIAQEAALIVASGRMDMLQLQTYEDIQNPDDVQELLFEMEINLSNLAQLPLQILEVSVHGETLEQPILLDSPALLRSESSHQLSQRFRHHETTFTSCHIFYMHMKQEQPQLYRLRCPLQWSEEKQCYSLLVGAQQIQAAISLESQSRYKTEPSLLNNFLRKPKAEIEQAQHNVDADALALALAQDDTAQDDIAQDDVLPDNLIAESADALTQNLAQDEDDAVPTPSPLYSVYDTIEEPLVEDAVVANLLLDSEEENQLESLAEEEITTPKSASMTKVLERWFDEDPNLKELPQDSFNTKLTTKLTTESYKTSWSTSEKKPTPKGRKFPERF